METIRIMIIAKALLVYLLIKPVTVLGAREPPTVTIPNQGMLMGTYLKMFRTQRIVGYLGVPYAHPPLELKRFMPPVVDNLPSWEGVRNATQLAADCMQDNRRPRKKHDEAFMKLLGGAMGTDDRQTDEDCLYLNIYIPDGPPPTDGYAVVAWLHSGDFSNGSPSDLDPFQLVFKQKLIVVTIAYRLNIFGFMTSMDGESQGNYGLMDQSAALLWIRNNIKLFGGNPNSVTLMGHGSGAVSASLHLTSGEWSEELFHRVILMSGTSLYEPEIREARDYSGALDRVRHSFGCNRRPTSELMDCMRKLSAQLLADNGPVVDWGPIIDVNLSNTTSPFIPEHPRIMIERGVLKKVPLLIGFTDMEEALEMEDMMSEGFNREMYDTFLMDIVTNDIAHIEGNESCGSNNQLIMDAVTFMYAPYPPSANADILRKKFIDFNVERKYFSPIMFLAMHMSRHASTYVYRFDIKPQTASATEGLPEWMGVPHGFDLIFVWGLPYWSSLESQTPWVSADKRVSDIIMTMWSNFAKFSNTTKFSIYIKWDPFTVENQGVLIVDRSFNMSDTDSLNYQAVQFWNDYYPRVVGFASQCCNATDGGSFIHGATARPEFVTMSILLLAFSLVNLST